MVPVFHTQDREDDAALGLKSTALYFGDRTKPILSAISAASIVSFTAAGTYMGNRGQACMHAKAVDHARGWAAALCAGLGAAMSWPYFVGVGIAGAHMMWQVRRANVVLKHALHIDSTVGFVGHVHQIHTMNMHDRWNLTSRFVSNKWVGLALFAGAVAGNLVM